MAEAALESLDLTMAEAAYVRCKDYPGTLFSKFNNFTKLHLVYRKLEVQILTYVKLYF